MKVGIIRCQEYSNECAAYHDLIAIREKTGAFARYDTVELIGIHTCGGCGRNKADKVLARALSLKEHGAEVIHLGVCMIYGCPFKELYEKGLKEKVGLPIVKGTHPHKPPQHLIEYPPSRVRSPASSHE